MGRILHTLFFLNYDKKYSSQLFKQLQYKYFEIIMLTIILIVELLFSNIVTNYKQLCI